MEIPITKEDFEAYEQVRSSGVTNMFNVTTVESLSGLTRRQIIEIMKTYDELNKKFPDIRGD